MALGQDFRALMAGAAQALEPGVIDEQAVDRVARQLDRLSGIESLARHINPATGDIDQLNAGSVDLSAGGLRVEGDETFAVFTGSQAYNKEAVEDGDVIFGSNKANQANIYWDKSSGELQFRGGTTKHGWIDVGGKATFGDGEIWLDSNGINIKWPLLGTYDDLNSIKWYDRDNLANDAVTRISAFNLDTTDRDDMELDLVVGSPIDMDQNTARFHLDLHTRDTTGTGLNTQRIESYFNYNTSSFSPGSPNWFDFNILAARLTRDGNTWYPFAFQEDPNNQVSWLAFDASDFGPYGYSIGTGSSGQFKIVSNYYIDQAGHDILKIEGRTPPLYTDFNPQKRDMDFAVYGTTNKVFGVDAAENLPQLTTQTKTSNASGSGGMFAVSGPFLYVHDSSQWRRVALSTF